MIRLLFTQARPHFLEHHKILATGGSLNFHKI